MATSGEFRPETLQVALSVFAGAVVGGLGVVLAVLGAENGPSWVVVAGSAVVAIGAWMIWRSFVLRVAFDADTLHIVGWTRTRRIPRTAILEVERGTDLELPLVRWALPGRPDRWSLLSPISLSSGAFVPGSMYRRRQRFLAKLRRWAPPESFDDGIRPGMWSRVLGMIGTATLAVWESVALRFASALAAIAVASGLWWFEWWSAIQVIAGDADAPRRMGGALFLAWAAAEGAYWLLPLRTRHPRAMRIVLAVLIAPAAIAVGIAMFGAP
ncbi:hypothetical protein [Agromyces arachidis]|uniref:hypothetical protein n=1 Tax=Agromyces arachidis TaxID=766966 RepID=UPI00405622D2